MPQRIPIAPVHGDVDQQLAESVDSVGVGRSARKRGVILDAARELFLRHGYSGTSMDDVAAAARVSKQTVYQHFGDKRRMFVQILTGDMRSADDTVAALAAALPESQDLETDLRVFARAYLAAVMQPHLMRLRRVVIGEAERFLNSLRPGTPTGPHRLTRCSPTGSRRSTGGGSSAPTIPSWPPSISTG